MSGLSIRAAYATVTDEDGLRYIGFVDAHDEDYVMFSRALAGGPVVLEINDPDFSAADAVGQALLAIAPDSTAPDSLELILRPELTGRFGFASRITLRLRSCQGAGEALEALRGFGLPGL